MAEKKRSLAKKDYIKAIWGIAHMSFRLAPGAVLFKLAGTVVNTVLPLITTYFAALTTTALTGAFAGDSRAGEQAIQYVVITAILGLASMLWSSIDNYIQQLMRYKVEAKVSDEMYEHFHQLEFWRYDDKETADVYDKAQRFSQFYAYVFDRITDLFSSLFGVIAAIVALYLAVPFIALVVLIAVLPGVYLQIKLSRLQMQHWNKNVGTRRSRSFIEWNLLQPDSISELRLNGLVRHLLDLRQSLRNKDEKEQLEFERKYIFKRLGSDAFQSLAELGSILWVTFEIIAQRQPLGQFVYVQQIVSRAMSSATSFVTQLSTIDEDLANLSDYRTFMSLKKATGGTHKIETTPNEIRLDDISFTYRGAKKPVLKNISFTIARGEHVAIVGENGAGKTTLIKLLAGLYEPSKGAIMIDDIDLRDVERQSWHQHISVLEQDFLKYQFTDVQGNVYYGDVSAQLDGTRYQNAVKAAEAEKFIDKLPHKEKTLPSSWMEDEDGNTGVKISGGQWQRLALARNFYRNSPIIILDEPTSAIDALAEARIFQRLFDKTNKKTVVTISHRMTTVEKADKIIVLDQGKVVEWGTHDQLASKKGLYYKMFESQLSKSEK